MRDAEKGLGTGILAVLVGCGSALGTLIRAVIERANPADVGEWPWATFVINIVGSMLLGIVVEALAHAGPDTGWRRVARLSVGTGVIGGFTTYSTYVVEADRLVQTGHSAVAVAYALVSIVVGVAAAGIGVGAAAAASRRYRSEVSE